MKGTKGSSRPAYETASPRYAAEPVAGPARWSGKEPALPRLFRFWRDVFARIQARPVSRQEHDRTAKGRVGHRALIAKAHCEPVRPKGRKANAAVSHMIMAAKQCLDEIAGSTNESRGADTTTDLSKLSPFPRKVRVRDRREVPLDRPIALEGKMEEEMVQLHQMVSSALQQNGHIIVQFAGSVRGEGTSTLAREFARVSATRFKKRTLLFDADWRQGSMGPLMRRTDPLTIEKVVRNSLPLEQALMCVRKPYLYRCLLSTEREFGPDLYDLPEMKHIWKHLRESFGVVVVDSCPSAEHQDTVIVAKEVDGVIFVMKAESTKWPVAKAAKQRIADSGGKILGMVLNDRFFHIPAPIYRRL